MATAIRNSIVPSLWSRKLSCKTFVLALLAGCIFFSENAIALPANPQRPLESQTCDAAKIRLYEALGGSPLISKNEISETIFIARNWVDQLCGPDITHKIMAEINGQAEHQDE